MYKDFIYFVILSYLTLSVSTVAITKTRLDNLVSELKSDDQKQSAKAAIELAKYGPEAEEAIPALLEMVRKDNLSLYARSILPYIYAGKPVEAILELTEDENSSIHSLAMSCLLQHNLTRDETLEIYTPLLDHESPFVRLEAVKALTEAKAGELCLDTAIQLTYHENPLIKASAISVIGDIGIANMQVKRVLLGFFSNTDKREVIKAALIYQKLFPREDKGIKEIQIFLNDEDPIARWHAVRAVGNLKGVDIETLDRASELMNDDDSTVKIHASYAMIQHGIEKEKAWQIINTKLESEEFIEVAAALMVIRDLGPIAHAYQDRLILMVNNKEDVVQLIAIGVLGEIQSSKADVLPVFENLLERTDDFFVCNITKKTIRKLEW